MPKEVKVQKIPHATVSPEDLIATLCYYYPAYTFDKARKLPHKRLIQMLRIARKEHARKMLELLQIVSAPHSKNGKMIKSLSERYNDIIKS